MARSIAVELPKYSYYTGEVVDGAVVLHTDDGVRCRALFVELIGREETKIERGSGKSRTVYKSSKDHVAWRLPLLGEGTIPAGGQRFPFRFQVPIEGLPSYQGRHAWMKYTLTARLDVPLWPDAVWSGELFLFYDRSSVRRFPHPIRFRSGGPGPEVFVDLDGDRFFARELIGCRITVFRLGGARVRRVYARLIGGEWAKADSVEEMTETYRQEWSIPIERVQEGVPFEFEMPIPADVQSSYHGTCSYYSYAVQVGLDIALATDVVAQTPIVIVR